jgi:DNA-binding response OmpR family regulator
MELAELKGEELVYPLEWRLSPRETQVLQVLERASGAVSREQFHVALYGLQASGGPDGNNIDVFVCHARQKLAPLSITISNRWGFGYSLDDTARAVIANARARMTGGA